jgi:hypothetical protein
LKNHIFWQNNPHHHVDFVCLHPAKMKSDKTKRKGEQIMFLKIIAIGIAVLVIIHGMIHLIGFRVYGQGVQMAEMPFKTTFFNGSLDLGNFGTRIYGWVWLLPMLGFILAGVGFFLRVSWWQPVLIVSSLASLIITGIDWKNAFIGTLIDAILLAVVLFLSIAARFGISFR